MYDSSDVTSKPKWKFSKPRVSLESFLAKSFSSVISACFNASFWVDKTIAKPSVCSRITSFKLWPF